MNKTILALGIIFLLIGASVVSSTGKIVKDYTFNNSFLESVNNQKGLLSCDHLDYVFSYEQNCFLYDFILNNPDNLTCVCIGGGGGSFTDFTWSCDDCIYCVEYATGVLWGIDPDSCDMWEVGGGGQGLNTLAYDSVTDRMFGISSNYPSDDTLWEINPDTGYQDYIGEIDLQYVVGMAFDADGVLYGWDLVQDSLHIIDPDTLEVETVGPLGINLNYAGHGDFCKEDDILFLATYIGPQYPAFLYEVDKETGDCKLIGSFPGYDSVTGFVIPYECDDTTPPVTNISFDPPMPDGENGWYISDVNMTLNATDDMSGVKTIYYKIPGDDWKNRSGDSIKILLDHDCLMGLIEFYSIDNAGNQEEIKSVNIDIDQLPPYVQVWYEITGGNPQKGWDIVATAYVTDNCSGMDRVEFYLNGGLQSVLTGSGPTYTWGFKYYGDLDITLGVNCCDIAGN